ncbi:phosphohistidine phosphatase [Aliarcobacter trophiarum LMG 25534]|uniref:Phosphohistidine phosphatase n=1 Tax=Aliarcobacter trophiarum LMG 25534 TaxID=1032241 RepID=A0AAD0VM41_9BACT|nr:histidine phosphatase family protein [Aliarcobacter trophiarum]AXK48814.1 phosphohistidine phosphatase [Aliarcobacter trophiarum LMG 25534]RXI25007.1 phosphohistidine phosphatase [Aliarcobacter trophiarum]RXJ92134.1 phosphohistidine phosphatase [Aliarcobacter trophiarum LMG 25534]
MKKLILIRHAKSSWSNPLLDDFDRPLNKRGEKNAPFMAKVLNQKELKPDLIISSPAKRTKDTLNYFLDEFKDYKKKVRFDQSIYEAPYTNLLNVIKSVEKEYDTLFFIGHNPGINDLSDFLLNGFYKNIPTTGILKIDLDIDSWDEIEKGYGNLDFFLYPKMFICNLC